MRKWWLIAILGCFLSGAAALGRPVIVWAPFNSHSLDANGQQVIQVSLDLDKPAADADKPAADADKQTPEQAPLPRTEAPTAPAILSGPTLAQYLFGAGAYTDQASLFWVEGDTLLWWTKDSPMRIPILTQGSFADVSPGALGQPNTTVLFGGSVIDFGASYGLRLGAGCWLPWSRRFGIESDFFVLEKRSEGVGISSGANGAPLSAHPFLNAQTGREEAEGISADGLFAGSSAISISSRVQGCETNFVANTWRGGGLVVDVLFGLRSLVLNETLTIEDNLVPLGNGVLFIQGTTAVNPPNHLTNFDIFRARNQFFGPQVGSRLDWHCGRVGVGLSGKLALGSTRQAMAINGGTSLATTAGPIFTVPGGIYAQSTNSGEFVRGACTVVPEIGLNLGMQMAPGLEARLGYNFIYWNNVARPGKQLDHTLNPRVVPSDGNFGAGGGPSRPIFNFDGSDFWAQGITFRLEYRY